MMKTRFVLIAAVFAGPFESRALAQAPAANQCIKCHSTLTKETLRKNFTDWESSIHRKEGIQCNECHAGVSSETDKVKAHAGVLPREDEKSAVNSRNIPQTCGRCHFGEVKEFKQSVHYQQLISTGKGPSCATCHRGKSGHILDADSITDTCRECHGRMSGEMKAVPSKAHLLMSILKQVNTILDWTAQFIDLSEKDRKEKKKMKRNLDDIRQSVKTGFNWHTFNLDNFGNNLIRSVERSVEIKNEAMADEPRK